MIIYPELSDTAPMAYHSTTHRFPPAAASLLHKHPSTRNSMHPMTGNHCPDKKFPTSESRLRDTSWPCKTFAAARLKNSPTMPKGWAAEQHNIDQAPT